MQKEKKLLEKKIRILQINKIYFASTEFSFNGQSVGVSHEWNRVLEKGKKKTKKRYSVIFYCVSC